MSVESAITSILNGAIADGRHYWKLAPQGAQTYPLTVINRISGGRDYTFSGGTGYVESRFQLDVYARTADDAITRASAIVSALSAYRGTTSGTRIMAAFVVSEADGDAEDPGQVTELHRRRLDFIIHHDE